MAAGNGSGRTTPRKPKASSNGNGNGGIAKATVEALLARKRPERSLPLQVDGEPLEVTLRAIPRPDYEALVEAHPLKDVGSVWPFDVDTFAPALVAACLVEPAMTLEQVQQIWTEWETEPLDQLWSTALDLNTGWSPRRAVGNVLSALVSSNPTSGSAPATPSTTGSATAT